MEPATCTEIEEKQPFTDAGIMFPSPNWFLPRIMAVSSDGWVVYGSTVRGICVLIPRHTGVESPSYGLFIGHRVHADRVSCVELSAQWPEKRRFVSGSTDGFVKQWALEEDGSAIRLQPLNAHNAHKDEKEELVGLSYSGTDHVISVGSTGVIVKWDLAANITRVYRKLMKGFKPLSFACSPHSLKLAVGTKQGILFVINLQSTRKPQILYKVRGHDDEITSICWCPLAEATVNKAGKVSLAQRLEKIRQEKTPQLVIEKKICKENKEEKDPLESNDTKENISVTEVTDREESVVEEDDMFDIYTDHAADEFGHKKFQPEDILVPVEKPADKSDFLAECLKLKKDIIESKNKPEESIHSLVQSLEKAVISKKTGEAGSNENGLTEANNKDDTDIAVNGTEDLTSAEKNGTSGHQNQSSGDLTDVSQSYESLLVTFDKNGKVCLWTNKGKLIGSSHMSSIRTKQTGKPSSCSGLHWPRADLLLMSDTRDNLLECNPLCIDSENRMEWKVLHSIHKRGMYCIASGAPKIQTSDSKEQDYPIWTVGQDRSLVHYSYRNKEALGVYATLGGFVYDIAPCPYDSTKFAIGAGDGALRVYTVSDELSRTVHRTTSYWQNVQGKVLAVAWHPTRENQVAFGTAEGRVGVIDVSGPTERPARVIGSPQSRGVYSVSWGERNILYVCSVGRLSFIDTSSHKTVSVPVEVKFEGKRWSPTEAAWHERGLCVGGHDGEVGILTPHPPHHMLAAAFHFQKQVHHIAWHPQGVTLSQEEAPYKNWIAANASENHIVVLELCEEESKFKLNELATIRGHQAAVSRVAWSPHHNGRLLSTSQDATVRVWNISAAGEVSCLAIFTQHKFSTLAAAWCPRPEDAHLVLTGGGDSSLRLWDVEKHPPHQYTAKTTVKPITFLMAVPEEQLTNQKPLKNGAEIIKNPKKANSECSDEEDVALAKTANKSAPRLNRSHLFPISQSQQMQYAARACRRLLDRREAGGKGGEPAEGRGDGEEAAEEPGDGGETADGPGDGGEAADAPGDGGEAVEGPGEGGEAVEGRDKEPEEGLDFVKMFGSQDEFNHLLDLEQERHLSLEQLNKWMVVGVMRGEIERVFQMAVAHDHLSPFLLTLAPMVSHRFWKDAVQAFLTQTDRLASEEKAIPGGDNGFAVPNYILRKMLLLLSQHNVVGAVEFLRSHHLYREAYVLARVRHMHDVAAALLDGWAQWAYAAGYKHIAAHCYMLLGNLMEASTVLSKSSDEELLGLAADIAARTGQETLAGTLVRRRYEQAARARTDDVVRELPARLALHLRLAGEQAPAGSEGVAAGKGEDTTEWKGEAVTEQVLRAARDVLQENIANGEVEETGEVRAAADDEETKAFIDS